ncbi:hypothetical protein LguiA_009980 [Lonicera macranthoides]
MFSVLLSTSPISSLSSPFSYVFSNLSSSLSSKSTSMFTSCIACLMVYSSFSTLEGMFVYSSVGVYLVLE